MIEKGRDFKSLLLLSKILSRGEFDFSSILLYNIIINVERSWKNFEL